jgi:hypothetical protein
VDVNGFQELVSAHQLRSQTNQKKITSMWDKNKDKMLK